MDYIINSKNRKIKTRILSFSRKLGFEFLHLTLGGKITIVGILLSFVALIFPWIILYSDAKSIYEYGAFSVFSSYVGYLVVVCSFCILFFTLSHTRKERVRAKLPIHMTDGVIIFFIGILLLILSFVISGMNRVSMGIASRVEIGDGLIILGIASIFFITGGILMGREERIKNEEHRYLTRSREDIEWSEYSHILHQSHGEKEKEKKNMSLPF